MPKSDGRLSIATLSERDKKESNGERGKLVRFTENSLMRAASKFLAPAQLLEKVERHRFVDAVLDRTSRGYIIVATRDTVGKEPSA